MMTFLQTTFLTQKDANLKIEFWKTSGIKLLMKYEIINPNFVQVIREVYDHVRLVFTLTFLTRKDH